MAPEQTTTPVSVVMCHHVQHMEDHSDHVPHMLKHGRKQGPVETSLSHTPHSWTKTRALAFSMGPIVRTSRAQQGEDEQKGDSNFC